MDKTILVAVVSAVSALIGVVISQVSVLLKEHLNKRHLKQILLREKYEILTDCVLEAITWSNKAAECRSIVDLNKFAVNEPLRKAIALSLIYFPEFKNAVGEFQNNYINFYNILVTSFRKDVNESAATQAVAHNRQEYLSSAKQFTLSRHEIDILIEKLASKYAKA